MEICLKLVRKKFLSIVGLNDFNGGVELDFDKEKMF